MRDYGPPIPEDPAANFYRLFLPEQGPPMPGTELVEDRTTFNAMLGELGYTPQKVSKKDTEDRKRSLAKLLNELKTIPEAGQVEEDIFQAGYNLPGWRNYLAQQMSNALYGPGYSDPTARLHAIYGVVPTREALPSQTYRGRMDDFRDRFIYNPQPITPNRELFLNPSNIPEPSAFVRGR